MPHAHVGTRAPTNPEMQKLVLELVDFVNAVNSRTGLKIAYEATLLAEAGRKEKMRTVVKQRWASLAELLRRVLKNLKAPAGTHLPVMRGVGSGGGGGGVL